MALIKYGTYTPSEEPTGYSVTESDIDGDGTGRGETGVMSRERLRSGVYKISLKYTNINNTEKENILKAIKPQSISVSFQFGGTQTATMYAGDRTADLKFIDKVDGKTVSYYDLSFDLVEL